MPRRRLMLSMIGCLGLAFGCSPVPPAGDPSQLPAPYLPTDLPLSSLSLPDTNPAEALQKAIDSLSESGGILLLPEGVFKLERQVDLRSNVHLVGVAGKTLLKGLGQGAILAIRGSRDVTLSQLILDGQNRDKLEQVILASDTQRLGIYACEIRNTGKDANGIELQKNVDQAEIIGNYLHDIGNAGDKWGTAITLGWDSSDATLTDNRIVNASRAGINAHNDCKNLFVARNDVRKLSGEGLGIELWNDCSGTVEHNKVSSWISFDGSEGVIQNNEVNGTWNGTNTPKYGIEVVSGNGVKVLANQVTAARMGLSIVKSSNCLFQGNVIDGGETGLQGYGATSPAKANAILDNTFKNGSGRAMMLNQNCDGWRIEGNVIERYGKSGIYLYGTDDATITKNYISYTGQTTTSGEAAIYWNSDRKTRLFLSGNTLIDNPVDYGDIHARFLP